MRRVGSGGALVTTVCSLDWAEGYLLVVALCEGRFSGELVAGRNLPRPLRQMAPIGFFNGMENLLHGLTSNLRIRGTPFKPQLPERTIAERKLEVERKTFFVSLKENHQGRFCRITEAGKGRRNSIIVAASGLPDFARLIAEG
jgi:PurA ssDNA and RNA-binding protein